jgi:D-alanine-D-alanine ligase
MNKRVIILHNKVARGAAADEADVLRQASYIARALKKIGFQPYKVSFSLKTDAVVRRIRKINPWVVFNIVESVENRGELIYLAPAILTFLKIPYAGAHVEAMYATSNKILAKKELQLLRIKTAGWYRTDETDQLQAGKNYIVKPIWEDGSLGIEEDSIFTGGDIKRIAAIRKLDPRVYFIEDFIEGREFNISVLGGKKGPSVMPPAEIIFKDYPSDKPRIVGYKAKWEEASFEYQNTPRTFKFPPSDARLLKELQRISLKCWKGFGLRGYARVDFRIDQAGVPYVLEINANPCIAPESGYVAAIKRGGLTFPQAIQRILEDAF